MHKRISLTYKYKPSNTWAAQNIEQKYFIMKKCFAKKNVEKKNSKIFEIFDF